MPVTEEARMRAVNMVLRRKLQDCRAASMKACADLCDDHGFTEAAKMLRNSIHEKTSDLSEMREQSDCG